MRRIAYFFLCLSSLMPSGFASFQGAEAHENPLTMLPMTLAFVVIFYLLIIRPQNKQKKADSEAINALKEGDEIALSSGIIGIITKIDGTMISLKIAKNTSVTVLKQKVAQIMPKNTYQE